MKTREETKQEVLDTTRGMTKADMVEWITNVKQAYEFSNEITDIINWSPEGPRGKRRISFFIGLLLGLLTSIFV